MCVIQCMTCVITTLMLVLCLARHFYVWGFVCNVLYCVPIIYSMVVHSWWASREIVVTYYYHFLLNSVWKRCPFIITQRLSDRMFHCFNINCNQQFGTERGLCLHLWHSPLCQEYMSRARKINVSVETLSTSRLVGYGVESTRLNFDMSTNAPS